MDLVEVSNMMVLDTQYGGDALSSDFWSKDEKEEDARLMVNLVTSFWDEVAEIRSFKWDGESGR